MAILLKRLTGSQGAGIGIGGTFLILFLGVGIWFAIHRTQKSRLKKLQSASSIKEATSSLTDKDKDDTTIVATTNTTDLRYNDSAAMEMGTVEGLHPS